MSFSTSRGSVFLPAAVRHVVTNARHYHNLVERAHLRDSVLRVIFVAGPELGDITERRASAVSLYSLEPDFAKTLQQLCSTCNRQSQFVCWLTVETSAGEPVDHTTLIVDKFEDQPIWEGPVHVPHETRARIGSSAAPTVNGSGRGVSFAAASSSPRDAEDVAALEAGLRDATFRLGDTFNTGTAAGGANGGGLSINDEVLGQRLSDIMTVALLTSKAAAKLVGRVDEAHARLDRIVDMAAPMTSGPTPQEVLDRVLSTLASMELRMRLIEEHVASMDLRDARARQAGVAYGEAMVREAGVQVRTAPVLRDGSCQTEEFDIVRRSPSAAVSAFASSPSLSSSPPTVTSGSASQFHLEQLAERQRRERDEALLRYSRDNHLHHHHQNGDAWTVTPPSQPSRVDSAAAFGSPPPLMNTVVGGEPRSTTSRIVVARSPTSSSLSPPRSSLIAASDADALPLGAFGSGSRVPSASSPRAAPVTIYAAQGHAAPRDRRVTF